MAKCVQNQETKKVIRVSNDRADVLVKLEGWKYCPKDEWRLSGRKYK